MPLTVRNVNRALWCWNVELSRKIIRQNITEDRLVLKIVGQWKFRAQHYRKCLKKLRKYNFYNIKLFYIKLISIKLILWSSVYHFISINLIYEISYDKYMKAIKYICYWKFIYNIFYNNCLRKNKMYFYWNIVNISTIYTIYVYIRGSINRI